MGRWVKSTGSKETLPISESARLFCSDLVYFQVLADVSGGHQDGIEQFLKKLSEKLIADFDVLAEQQKQIPAKKFNDDDNYKQYLNAVSASAFETKKPLLFFANQ